MELKELLEDVPRGLLIGWAIGATLSLTVTGLVIWALIKYIGSE